MPGADVNFRQVDGEQAAADFGELRALYSEVYAERPYEWGEEHAGLFAERFEVQHRQEGFAPVEARDGTGLAGLRLRHHTPAGHPVVEQPDHGPAARGHHRTPRPHLRHGRNARPGTTETAARRPGPARPAAADRPEERATLTVLAAAAPARAACAKWGWHRVAQKRNPLPGSPLFNVLVKQRRSPAPHRTAPFSGPDLESERIRRCLRH